METTEIRKWGRAEAVRLHHHFSIGVDIDDVIAEWYWASHAECVKAGITNGVEPSTWSPFEEYRCSLEEWVKVLSDATLRGYMLEIPVVAGARRALLRLQGLGHEIHLVTARGYWANAELIRAQTKMWLTQNLIPHHSLTFSKEKDKAVREIGLDFFIDDNVRNFLAVSEAGAEAYLVNRPWNRNAADVGPDRRVDHISEFVNIITERSLTA